MMLCFAGNTYIPWNAAVFGCNIQHRSISRVNFFWNIDAFSVNTVVRNILTKLSKEITIYTPDNTSSMEMGAYNEKLMKII